MRAADTEIQIHPNLVTICAKRYYCFLDCSSAEGSRDTASLISASSTHSIIFSTISSNSSLGRTSPMLEPHPQSIPSSQLAPTALKTPSPHSVFPLEELRAAYQKPLPVRHQTHSQGHPEELPVRATGGHLELQRAHWRVSRSEDILYHQHLWRHMKHASCRPRSSTRVRPRRSNSSPAGLRSTREFLHRPGELV